MKQRLLLMIAISLVIIVVAAAIATDRIRSNAHRIATELIETRFDRTVDLETLTLEVFPYARASGAGLVVHQRAHASGLPPFISIRTFAVEVDLVDLLIAHALDRPIRIDAVRLDALEIHVPPDDDDDDSRAEPPPGPDGDRDDPLTAFVIDRITAANTLLTIHPEEADGDPLVWDIHQLDLRSAGTTEPMVFEALLRNAKPPGLVETRGSFGPWRKDDLRNTAVSGEYVFEEADLGVFDGIRGTLASTGTFEGVLGQLTVVGTTDTPDFALDVGGTIHLKTEFTAIVDGTNGDTRLEPVTALLDGTRLVARGGVVDRTEEDGKTITLDVVTEGRLEDLLRLGMKSEEPFITGSVGFRARFELPQGEGDVIEKLRLEGRFRVGEAEFSNATQERIDRFSSTTRGEPGRAAPPKVASDLEGRFALAAGRLEFSDLTFQVPGARVELRGTYGLLDEEIDMKGRLNMEASLSEATTGLKSFFLRFVNPFFRGENGGSSVPIKITGTRTEPDFGLNLGGS